MEQVEALREAGDLDVENNLDHAKLVLAASVLGSRERYLRVKGMLSGVDTSKLPVDTGDLMNTIFSEADVDRVLAEAGTSFDEIPKGGDLLHAILPEGKLRNNVLAFNMWSGSEGARGLSPAERRAAISQVENADELTAAMNTIIRNEGEDITGGIAVWKQLDEPVMPLISASAEQDLKKYTPPDGPILRPKKIVASRKPAKPDSRGDDTRTRVDAFTYGAEIAGENEEILDAFTNSVNEAIEGYTDEPTILEITGGLQSIMNQDLSKDPLEKVAEALNTGKGTGRVRGEYEVVDGRLIRTSKLPPNEEDDVTEAAEFLINRTRQYQATTEVAQSLVEEPINPAEGLSGSVAVVSETREQAAITDAALEGMNGIIKSYVTDDGEKTLISWSPLDAADEVMQQGDAQGYMSMRPIIEGTENVKQVQMNQRALQETRQSLLDEGWSEVEVKQIMAYADIKLVNHEMLHVFDYQKDDDLNRTVWGGQYLPASGLATAQLREVLGLPDDYSIRDAIENDFLSDENISKVADPVVRKRLEVIKEIYSLPTIQDLIRNPEEMGIPEKEMEDYYATVDEVLARAFEVVMIQETFKKNGLGEFLPQRETELWEAVEQELGADAAERLWRVESYFFDDIESDLSAEELEYYKRVVVPWYTAQQQALRNAPQEIQDAFMGQKLQALQQQKYADGSYIRSGMPRRRSIDQAKTRYFSPEETEAMAPQIFKFLETLDVLEPDFKYEGRSVSAEKLKPRGENLPTRPAVSLARTTDEIAAGLSDVESRLQRRGPAASQTSVSRRVREQRSVSTVLADVLSNSRSRPDREVDISSVQGKR